MIACLELFFLSVQKQLIVCSEIQFRWVIYGGGGKLDRLTKITMNRWTLVYYLFLVSHFFSKLPVFPSCYSSNWMGENAWRIFNYPSQKLLPCGGNRCSVNSIFIFHVLWKIGKTKILLRTEAYDLFKIKWGKRR